MRWTAQQVHAAHKDSEDCHRAVLSTLRRSDPFSDGLPDTGIDPALERALSSPFIELPGYGTRCSTIVEGDNEGCRALRERSFNQHGQRQKDLYWKAGDKGELPWTTVHDTLA